MSHRFHQGERLKSRKVLSQLFDRQGESFGQYPLRLVWMPMEERRSEFPVQFGLSVPKRRFKRAVVRNRLRRRIREAYRLHKHQLHDALADDDQQLAWMVLYIGKEEHDFAQIDAAMRQMIRRFIRAYRKRKSGPTS